MRLELRAQRPPSELLDDTFSKALDEEHAILIDVISQIVGKLENGQELVTPLEEAKAEMHASRLTLHLDRTGYTQELLERVVVLEKAAGQFCRDAVYFLGETGKRCKKALAKTCSSMKQRITATIELKDQIEKDMAETRRTIHEAELHLDRLERQLQVQLAMPERSMGNQGGDFCNKKLAAHTGVLADLRAKIKAAAYTGGAGRQLTVLFARFDRDRSGMLDEDEVRRAFRRACRIPPSAVSDAEIASLCQLLDEDKSGSVSINEIIDFLCADVNVESLEEQCNFARAALTKLKGAQLESQADLRNKVAAWKIDAACSRVNPIKGLKLDTLPSPGRPTTGSVSASSARGPALPATPGRPATVSTGAQYGGYGSKPLKNAPYGSPRKPKSKAQPALPALTARGEEPKLAVLDKATMDSLRSKIKAAAYTGSQGKQLDVIFSRFDKDGSGTLGEEEIKQALRRTLRIPPALVSDSDIATLCSMLDEDKSGSVSIAELMAFVGKEPEVSKRGVALKPLTQTGQAGPPDESAGPANS